MSHFKKEEEGEKNKAYLFPLKGERKNVCAKTGSFWLKENKTMYHANQFTT